MEKEQKLIIKYRFSPKLNYLNWKLADKLDIELEKIAKKLRYKFEGSGFDFKTKIKDFSFYKK